MSVTDEISRTLGAAFFTFVCGCVLYGVTLSQVYQYFKVYPEDERVLKVAVALICLVDSLHSAFSIHMMWSWTVKGLGDDIASARVIWSIKAVGYLHVFMMLFVQGIYLSRIYIFTRKSVEIGELTSIFVRISTMIGGLLALSAVVVFLIELQKVEVLLDFASGAKWIIYFVFSVTCAIDIGITVGMCFVLNRSKVRIRGVHLASNVVLSKIIIFFISSGLLTTIIAIVYMILYAALPDVLLFVAATFSTSKLYANSVLAMINGRRHLRSEFMRPRDLELSEMHFNPRDTGESSFSMGLSPIREKKLTGKRGRSTSDIGSMTVS
ncbi:hypothetical protein P691DRAFT_808715 [Macrolepiota fuliginosa MF-IS2]|uniref:DUF6534 domain-containing protein n=1 Tax=Macrolepiota fuliginosa MF-IS2 TaxID=1400762 RepID=A0A9P6BZG2_9AGAR|nr:hypothetical protein P691DRAFT_808715 [Macrolepiota fuliginosa MF-IS2]